MADFEKRKCHRWTAEEDDLVATSALSLVEIAEILGLTSDVVKGRAYNLRKLGRQVPHRRSAGAQYSWSKRVTPGSYRDPVGHKVCRDCGLHLPPTEEFWSHNRSTIDRLRPNCKRCGSDSHHHLSAVARWSMLAVQRYMCALPWCENELELFGKNTYHIDHNHKCCGHDGVSRRGSAPVLSCGLCIRGLLCRRCNILLNRDIELVLRHASALDDYLTVGNPVNPVLASESSGLNGFDVLTEKMNSGQVLGTLLL